MIVETVRTLKAEASLEFDKSSSQFRVKRKKKRFVGLKGKKKIRRVG